jgi:hypothetical protein
VSDDIVRVEILSEDPARVTVEEPRSQVVVDDKTRAEVLVNLVGIQGAPGPGLVAGAGTPTADIGKDSDLYLDVNTGDIYGPKLDGEWPTTPSLRYDPPTRRFSFEQAAAAALWDIEHPLGGRPSVSVVDTSGSVVIGDVTYLSDTNIVVSFSAPFAGFAYLT